MLKEQMFDNSNTWHKLGNISLYYFIYKQSIVVTFSDEIIGRGPQIENWKA